LKIADWLAIAFILAAAPLTESVADSMTGMTGPNYIMDGQFQDTEEVAYPWTGVDEQGYLRKSVQEKGVNIYVNKSNQFSYDYLSNSASFIDVDGDGLPDIVAPDGAGFFWFWKNIGSPGNPKFGFGEVMPLLIDNERSQFVQINPPLQSHSLTPYEQQEKQRVDARREKAVERIERENRSHPGGAHLSPDEIAKQVAAAIPYPWENQTPAAPAGSTVCTLNGYRQLRAVAAPCSLSGNGMVDFVVGDAQGSIYLAKNTGSRGQPNYRTYTKSQDSLILKLLPDYDIVTHKTTLEPVNFMNYATPFVCDWNRDGRPDLLVGEGTYSVNAIRLFVDPFENTLSGGDANNEHILVVGQSSTFLSPFAWDWEGTGYLDLFVNDGEGHLRVYPNPRGEYCSGNYQMTDYKDITFEGRSNTDFLKFCCPQPCDWNGDGVMDLIWADPFGRIFYALGKAKGSTEFGPPTPVMSVSADRVQRLALPRHARFCAVPATHNGEASGGTADAERLITDQNGGAENIHGWPGDMTTFFGLMPSWEPEIYLAPDDRGRMFYPIPRMPASWAVAPVPYEVFNVIKDDGGGNGAGNTFTLSWHDPSRNAVFKQPRDAMTSFGQGVAYWFDAIPEKSPQLLDSNIRVSFFIKLDGRFDRLDVAGHAEYFDGTAFVDGGNLTFKTIAPPPIGDWFHYESVMPKGKFPRNLGPLEVRLQGRGDVSIRDVAYSSTHLPPDGN
jgi:hypothetical protein